MLICTNIQNGKEILEKLEVKRNNNNNNNRRKLEKHWLCVCEWVCISAWFVQKVVYFITFLLVREMFLERYEMKGNEYVRYSCAMKCYEKLSKLEHDVREILYIFGFVMYLKRVSLCICIYFWVDTWMTRSKLQ